jgi:hypothetical protein
LVGRANVAARRPLFRRLFRVLLLVASAMQRLTLRPSRPTRGPQARVISGTSPESRVPTTTETPLSRKAFSSTVIETELLAGFTPYFYTKSATAVVLSLKRNLAVF